jgi:AraC-like DNA-binding protein
MNWSPIQRAFFVQLTEPFTGEELFDSFTDLVYFIKNTRSQYMLVNQAMVERCGFQHKQDLIGRTADQVYPAPLGQSYHAQDEAVIRTGKPILNHLELQIYPGGRTGWCVTSKVPLRGRDGQIQGLAGISKDLKASGEAGEDYTTLAAVIEHIHAHYDEPLKLQALAEMAGLSPYQFEQRMRKIFVITAGQFIQKVRMDAATRRLRETEDSIADIALDCGYSDQSTFTRQFKLTAGLSPARYRRLMAEPKLPGKGRP